LTTWCSNSSVCRWPFISAPARPLRTIATACDAASSWVGVSTISTPEMSSSSSSAMERRMAPSPNRTGVISPCRAPSSAPSSASRDSGATTAVTMGS
jgi:hypothetical protein